MRDRISQLRILAASRWGGYALSAVAVFAATAVLLTFRTLLGKDVVALLYVPLIIASAAIVGRRGWWFAPTLAFLGLNFFFTPPYYTLYVASPHDWLLLGIFLVVGILSSLEVGRLQQRTREASSRLDGLVALNRLSRSFVSEASIEDMARTVSNALSDSAERVQLMVSESGAKEDLSSVVGAPSDIEMGIASWVFAEGKAVGLPVVSGVERADEPWPVSVEWPERLPGPRRGLYLPLLSSARTAQGVLLVEAPASDPVTVDQARLFVSIANLVAAFVERHQLQAKAIAFASLEEADKLKSSFISGISHDVKTPLAAAKARVTGLLEDDVPCEAERQREDLAAVASNLDRLDATLGDLMDLSRLESDAWRPVFETHEMGEILSTMLSHLPDPLGARVVVLMPAAPALVVADFRQMERAVRNVVENALIYSGGDVSVSVRTEATAVTVIVEDRGPGIRIAERERVFEPFVRGSAVKGSASGTGLGLAITREIVRAHGGRILIEDAEPCGTRVVISLPNRDGNDANS